MEKTYLMINVGSASKEYTLFHAHEDKPLEVLFHAYYDETILTVKYDHRGHREQKKIAPETYAHSAQDVFEIIESDVTTCDAIAFRIVAPGVDFVGHQTIDSRYIDCLQKAEPRAPLHIVPTLHELKVWEKLLPKPPRYAISDSAFHATMPDYARLYALPQSVTKKYELYRFGYHGISCASIVRKLKAQLGAVPDRLLVCHLGGGASITAVKHGISIDTSMGFTPLEGVPMATRVGNIDAGVVLYLAQHHTSAALSELFNKRSGLFGLSQKTADMRVLLAAAQEGDKDCLLALEVYAYELKKYIGAYFVALGGLDMLVFTGAIGEHAPMVRSLICGHLDIFGLVIDKQKNSIAGNGDWLIQSEKSSIQVGVMATDETHEMAYVLMRMEKLA